MFAQLRPAIVVFLLLSAITGILYPLAVTGIAQWAFPSQANGSILTGAGGPVGSSLIGQEFSLGADAPRHFWGRLSATGPVPYTPFNSAAASGSTGSNLAPTNPILLDNAAARIHALRSADAAAGYRRDPDQPTPIDLVTSSASGLDPHISLAAADYQLPRVAMARGITEDRARACVQRATVARQWGVLGEPVVNVLHANLLLDSEGR